MARSKSLGLFVLVFLLSACSSGGGWHWQHPQGLDAAQRERDLADCLYYASITDPLGYTTGFTYNERGEQYEYHRYYSYYSKPVL